MSRWCTEDLSQYHEFRDFPAEEYKLKTAENLLSFLLQLNCISFDTWDMTYAVNALRVHTVEDDKN